MSFLDVCNNVANNVDILNESELWHSRLCHVNAVYLMRLAKIILIPNFNVVKGSKCYVCVQLKQPRKPHKAAKTRNLALLVRSDLCNINGELTKGGR